MVICQIGSVVYHWYRSGVLGKVAGGSWDHHNPPTKDGFFVSQETYLEIHDIFGSLAHKHQSSDNSIPRVGGKSSTSTEAGIFHATTAAETTSASIGAATKFCGRVFYQVVSGGPIGYRYSTGLGTSEFELGTKHVGSDCLAYKNAVSERARCYTPYISDRCPLGWGNSQTLRDSQPGCSQGSYYLNPTPASNVDLFTGSQTHKCYYD